MGKLTEPIYALEYIHSVVHMLRDICFILATRSSYQSKAISFRVADILSSITHQGILNVNESKNFKELFQIKTRDKLISIFEHSQLRTLKNLSTKSDKLYNDLRTIICESVWVPGKKVTKGILVGDRQEPVDPDSFCSEVLRTLRNTHHGYFSRGSSTSNKTKYLSLIDGNVPDSLSSIAILWCLAFLECPESIVGKPSAN